MGRIKKAIDRLKQLSSAEAPASVASMLQAIACNDRADEGKSLRQTKISAIKVALIHPKEMDKRSFIAFIDELAASLRNDTSNYEKDFSN